MEVNVSSAAFIRTDIGVAEPKFFNSGFLFIWLLSGLFTGCHKSEQHIYKLQLKLFFSLRNFYNEIF